MSPHPWPSDDNAALFTDLYELTMLQAYHREGMAGEAVFDLFMRQMPHRNALIACGLDTALHYLERLRFTSDALTYLGTLDLFDDAFLEHLETFRFTGDVYAVPEGTPVFPDEPILEVVAPIGEAQFVETFLLNQITFQTGIASKARRVVRAAQGRTVADFGMRRMHGTDAALRGARAMYVAGVDATSNVLAGQAYGLPVTGTMAHSYVEAHESERNAFRAFAKIYPDTTLLVDTYDTLEGVRKVVQLAEELGDAFTVGAVRLDSGDLAALALEARQLLDDAGLTEVDLFASSSLDENAIAALLDRGAPLDGFGVGTRLGTMADQPYLDSAYKLCAYDGTSRMKLSSEKSNLPGRKQVYRIVEDSPAARDVIATLEEEKPDGGRPLLQCVMKDGQRTEAGQSQPLEALRQQGEAAWARLPERIRALDMANPPYPIELSAALQEKLEATRKALEVAT